MFLFQSSEQSLSISSIWTNLEAKYGEVFSLYLKPLLIECGYDSFQTLLNIVIGSIRQMESYLNDNRTEVTQSYCNQYKINKNSFKFKPAHRDIILSIPCICEDLEEDIAKIVNPPAQKKMKKSESASATKKKILKPEMDKQPEKTERNSTIGLLKMDLLTKVMRCAQELDLKLKIENITEQNIINFKRSSGNEYLYKCHLSCPFCQNPYTVNYKTSWDTTNIRRHFRRQHLGVRNEPRTVTSSTETTTTAGYVSKADFYEHR